MTMSLQPSLVTRYAQWNSLIAADAALADKRQYSPGRTRFEDYNLIEQYFHAATTLLAHVKIALDARFPFMDTETDISKLMNACRGDDDEKDFVNNVDKYLHSSPKTSMIRSCD